MVVPFNHPFYFRIFHEINQPATEDPPLWKPPYGNFLHLGMFLSQHLQVIAPRSHRLAEAVPSVRLGAGEGPGLIIHTM